jgi:hypothetical protein
LGTYKWKEKKLALENLGAGRSNKEEKEKLTRELNDLKRLVHFLADYVPGRDLFDGLEDPFKYPNCPEDVVITPERAAELGCVHIFHGQGKNILSDQVYVRDMMRAKSKLVGLVITMEVFFSPSEVVKGVELINAPGANSSKELSVLKEALDDADRVLVVTTRTGIEEQEHLHDLLRDHVLDRAYREEVDIGFVVNEERDSRRSGRKMLEEEATLLKITTDTQESTNAFVKYNIEEIFQAQRNRTDAERERLRVLRFRMQNDHVVCRPVLYTSLLTNEDA